jgi:hypothetical protein
MNPQQPNPQVMLQANDAGTVQPRPAFAAEMAQPYPVTQAAAMPQPMQPTMPPVPAPQMRVSPESIYPAPSSVAASHGHVNSDDYQSFRVEEATSDFREVVALIFGLASAVSPILVAYFLQNLWIVAAVSAVFALVSVFFAMKNYNAIGKVSPLTVIGLSAATITILVIADILITRALVQQALGSGYSL